MHCMLPHATSGRRTSQQICVALYPADNITEHSCHSCHQAFASARASWPSENSGRGTRQVQPVVFLFKCTKSAMKTCSKEKLVGSSFKRIVLTCMLLGFLILPAMVMYRELKQPVVVRPDLEESDAEGSVVNAEKLMSLRCDRMLLNFFPLVPVRGLCDVAAGLLQMSVRFFALETPFATCAAHLEQH